MGHHRPTGRRLGDQGEDGQRGDLPRRVDEEDVVGGGVGHGEPTVVGHEAVGIAVDSRLTGDRRVDLVGIVGRLIGAEAGHGRGRPAAQWGADQVTEERAGWAVGLLARGRVDVLVLDDGVDLAIHDPHIGHAGAGGSASGITHRGQSRDHVGHRALRRDAVDGARVVGTGGLRSRHDNRRPRRRRRPRPRRGPRRARWSGGGAD